MLRTAISIAMAASLSFPLRTSNRALKHFFSFAPHKPEFPFNHFPPGRTKFIVRPFCIATSSVVKSKDELQTINPNTINPTYLSCSMPDKKPLKLAVLLSGGVDSSVALRLLHLAGHSCTAFYLKIWFQEDFENFWSECPWEEDLKYARAVCDQVDVPLEVVHLTDDTGIMWSLILLRSIDAAALQIQMFFAIPESNLVPSLMLSVA